MFHSERINSGLNVKSRKIVILHYLVKHGIASFALILLITVCSGCTALIPTSENNSSPISVFNNVNPAKSDFQLGPGDDVQQYVMQVDSPGQVNVQIKMDNNSIGQVELIEMAPPRSRISNGPNNFTVAEQVPVPTSTAAEITPIRRVDVHGTLSEQLTVGESDVGQWKLFIHSNYGDLSGHLTVQWPQTMHSFRLRKVNPFDRISEKQGLAFLQAFGDVLNAYLNGQLPAELQFLKVPFDNAFARSRDIARKILRKIKELESLTKGQMPHLDLNVFKHPNPCDDKQKVEAPSNLHVEIVDHVTGTQYGKARLTWTDNSTNEQQFIVYRQATPQSSVEPNARPFSIILTSPAKPVTGGQVVTYDDTLQTGFSYSYRVQAQLLTMLDASHTIYWNEPVLGCNYDSDSSNIATLGDITDTDHDGWGDLWDPCPNSFQKVIGGPKVGGAILIEPCQPTFQIEWIGIKVLQLDGWPGCDFLPIGQTCPPDAVVPEDRDFKDEPYVFQRIVNGLSVAGAAEDWSIKLYPIMSNGQIPALDESSGEWYTTNVDQIFPDPTAICNDVCGSPIDPSGTTDGLVMGEAAYEHDDGNLQENFSSWQDFIEGQLGNVINAFQGAYEENPIAVLESVANMMKSILSDLFSHPYDSDDYVGQDSCYITAGRALWATAINKGTKDFSRKIAGDFWTNPGPNANHESGSTIAGDYRMDFSLHLVTPVYYQLYNYAIYNQAPPPSSDPDECF
jgi:hypothetical protein